MKYECLRPDKHIWEMLMSISRTHHRGLILAECLLAIVVLAVAILGITYASVAGWKHVQSGDTGLRATRLAEWMLEEIQSRPYAGTGATRTTFCIDNYNNFSEAAGNIRDSSDSNLPDQYQEFARSVKVTDDSLAISQLHDFTVNGKTIEVTVSPANGQPSLTLTRFVPFRVSP